MSVPAHDKNNKSNLKRSALWTGAGVWALAALDPIWVSGVNIVKWSAAGVVLICAPQLTAAALRKFADIAEHMSEKIPSGVKGNAEWAKSLKDLGDAVLPFSFFKQNHGLYMGCLKRGFFGFGASPVFLKPDVPVVFINGTSGSGKNVGHSDILLHTLPSSKFHIDYKEEDAPKYAKPLEERGFRVRVLNYAGQFKEQIGRSDSYNYMMLTATSFERENGGILDVDPDATEHAHIIIPEPKSGGSNIYFRIGSREICSFVEQMEILLWGKNANYADVISTLRDREKLLNYALWAAGRLKQDDGTLAKIALDKSPWAHFQDPEHIERYAANLASLGGKIADEMSKPDTRQFDSFLQGVAGELSGMHSATRAFDSEAHSTFSFSELKDDEHDTVIFVIPDNTREKANAKRMELLFSNLKKELVRHKNKKKHVTVILQEINNWTFPDLISFISWCRAYGITLVLYTQSLKSFADRYGDNALAAVLAEAQYQLWLPGLRDEFTLKLLESALGNESIMVKNNSGQRSADKSGVDGFSYSEQAKPLLYANQVKRLKKRGILIVKDAPPALVRLPSIAAIWPLRNWQKISPFYNKKYRERVTLRLLRYAPWMPANVLAERKKRRKQQAVMNKKNAESANA